MKYLVFGEWRYEGDPEVEKIVDSLEEAEDLAGRIRDDGGWAEIEEFEED